MPDPLATFFRAPAIPMQQFYVPQNASPVHQAYAGATIQNIPVGPQQTQGPHNFFPPQMVTNMP